MRFEKQQTSYTIINTDNEKIVKTHILRNLKLILVNYPINKK
jgi:hypothetical protein